MKNSNRRAIIILHEIYGVNQFINEVCEKYKALGFDTFCPDMINRTPFLYNEAQQAYEHFMLHTGFDYYIKINKLILQLKNSYDQVYVLGFSVGATIAWRCCESSLCDGIICCYGSRIRDYTDLKPVCSVLLIFAKKESFNVEQLVSKLQKQENITTALFEAEHGFLNKYSASYDKHASKCAEDLIHQFLST